MIKYLGCKWLSDRRRSGAGYSRRPTRESNPESNGFAGRRTTVVKWAELGVTDRTRTG